MGNNTPDWQTELKTKMGSLQWPKELEKTTEPILPPLLPLIAQDVATGDVLMLGYVSVESLLETLRTGNMVFYSRSRNKLWMKGEQSGHVLRVVDVRIDCDADTLLALVDPVGPTCHRNSPTCFDHPLPEGSTEGSSAGFVQADAGFAMMGRLWRTIGERLLGADPQSYSYKLVQSGLDRVLKKVGEEAAETLLAAKNAEATGNSSEFVSESSDLFYHWLLACAKLEVDPFLVMQKLKERVGAPRRDAH